MPKTTRLGGPSKADGTQERPRHELPAGSELELSGAGSAVVLDGELAVGGAVTLTDSLVLDGATLTTDSVILDAATLTAPAGHVINANGVFLSTHDALYILAPNMESDGTYIPAGAADAHFARWSLADGATQRVKFMFPVQLGWESAAFKWGWSGEAAVAGNVKWELAYRQIYPLLAPDLNDSTFTTIDIPAIAAGSQHQMVYSFPTETQSIATPSDGFLGSKPWMMCSLKRTGGAGTDNYAGAVSVNSVTLTRIT